VSFRTLVLAVLARRRTRGAEAAARGGRGALGERRALGPFFFFFVLFLVAMFVSSAAGGVTGW
jgi:hypothetical protein